jgi:UDP:flavonoid glycosyltransferase YjiC (YdhE family)
MKILISTFGVQGDVQPYLALAVGLQGAGHRVTLATSHSFTDWIQAYGVARAVEIIERHAARAGQRGREKPVH